MFEHIAKHQHVRGLPDKILKRRIRERLDVTNSGTLEATGSGGLVADSALANAGSLWANGGNIVLHGDVTGAGEATISGMATLEFGAASDQNVTFADGAAGTLKLDVLAGFTGSVSGFAAESDTIDLSTIDANTGVASDRAFAFAGNNADTVANSVIWFESDGNTILQIDNTGDTTADMQIILVGTNLELAATDFIL